MRRNKRHTLFAYVLVIGGPMMGGITWPEPFWVASGAIFWLCGVAALWSVLDKRRRYG